MDSGMIFLPRIAKSCRGMCPEREKPETNWAIVRWPNLLVLLGNLARPAGFEPTTPWFVELNVKLLSNLFNALRRLQRISYSLT
jgi:hypothetical protein